MKNFKMTIPNVFATDTIPLSLYIHIPWCKKKCPYCDFNSHEIKFKIPEEKYCEALLKDFFDILPLIEKRKIKTIFLGGGTPNLFTPHSINKIISNIKNHIDVVQDAEISLESNPGSLNNEQSYLLDNLSAFKDSGVTRLSVGIQSFNDAVLKDLGRLYDGSQAFFFLKTACEIFKDINVDLMYGNPNQTIKTATDDLTVAISFKPNHFSLYQLAIEPNTLFFKNKPILPNDDQIWEMYTQNLETLKSNGYGRYEISAFSLPNKECKHNLNYWQFGDYVGIGAGAHSKLTKPNSIERHICKKNPNEYINLLTSHPGSINFPGKLKHRAIHGVSSKDLLFEFMLNGLRLVKGVNLHDFTLLTGCSRNDITERINSGIIKGFLETDGDILRPTLYGLDFLNELQLLFMPE